MTTSEVRVERSFCRICTSLCGILVETAGDRVLRVEGDREHPLSQGYTCPKGRALPRIHHHPDRLERPLVRRDGALRPASWEHCLDDLGSRLRAIIDRHGPGAVGIYFGSGVGMDAAGYRMAQQLHAAIGTPAKFSPLTIDGTAKVLIAHLMGGFPGLGARPDYAGATLLIYIGVNPVVSHGHATAMPLPPPTTIKAVRDRGEVWVIDPRRSETATFATRHIAPHPGADFAILAFLARELLRQGVPAAMADRLQDVDALRAAVEPFARAQAAAMAGVSTEELDALLAAVRRAGRLVIDTGTGVTMSAEANLTQWLAWVVMILTDSMNRPGGVWFHPGFLAPMDAAPLPVLPPEAIYGPGPPTRPDLRSIIGEWPCAVLPAEIEAGNIRALLNLGGSLITAFPDENALRPALERLELFATIEIIANATTALSTHVLPTKDQLERPDITLWDSLSSCVSLQYTPALVAPVGERRSTWWVLAELLRRLGHEPALHPAEMGAAASDDAMLVPLTAQARCTHDELVAARFVERPLDLPARWVDEHIGRLGGWRLAPASLVEQLRERTQFWNEQAPRPGACALDEAAELAATPPLRLIPRRQRRHVNAQLLFLGDSPEVLMHPVDAAGVGVADGQRVIVRSERGVIEAIARSDPGMRPGAVSVPHGYEGANVNALTDARAVDLLTGMARYSGIPVSVAPAD